MKKNPPADTIIKKTKNIFILEKENNTIKQRTIKRNIANVFRLEKENKRTKDIIKTQIN